MRIIAFITFSADIPKNLEHIGVESEAPRITPARGPPLWDECAAHMAAEVIAGELQGNKELAAAAFNARVIPSVAYTDPEVAWVGLTETETKAQGIKVKKGLFPWSASGRAIANGRDEGVTKLLFDDSPEAHGHGKILGCGMVGTHARHRQNHPPAPHAGREYRHGGGSGTWQLHGLAARTQVNQS